MARHSKLSQEPIADDDHRAFGALGEKIAATHLGKLGYRIVTTNHRCDRGEIDIIAWDGQVLCFVEVRARRSDRFGHPLETISAKKRQRIVAAARDYLATWRGAWPQMRFDVVGIVDGDPPQIELVRAAFEVTGT
ncbi:MAG: YraN family protein [Myxococcota bacterium]